MKKKILIVLEEIIQGIPSGVVSVTDNLIGGIYKDFEVTILTNKTHWITNQKHNFKNINRIKKEKINFYTYSELNFFLQKRFNKIVVKLFLLPIKLIKFFLLVNFAYNFLKKKKIQIVINQSGGWPGGEFNLAFSCASYFLRIKNILIVHNLSSYKKNFLSKFIYLRDRVYNRTASEIITVSKICKLDLLKNTYLKNLKVVKNGSQDFSKLKKLKIKNINKKKFIIGYVGHIHERKGIEIVLNSIKNTKNEIQFVIIGGGNKDYVLYLEKIANKNNIDVLFVDMQKKFFNFYSYFDIFILPSKKFESFGLVVIEAMSCARSIICSNFGGMKEIIKNNHNGLLFKKNDSVDLTKKINYLKNNVKFSNKMSKNAKIDFNKLYTSDIMVKKYKKYF
jgi:teichuronic acid biosynthesis glycosyltransferase TuaC